MVQVRLEDDWRVFQVDVNVNKKPHEVYSALCQVLDVKSTPAEPCYLECNGVVVTQHNVCQLLRAGCIVRLCRGVPPADAGGIHTPSGYATARLWPHDVDMAGEEPHADPVSRGGVGARPYTSGEGEPPAPAANGHSTLQRTLSIPQDSAGQGQPSPSPRRRTSSFAMGWGATGQARPSGHSSRVSARLYRPKTGAMAAQEAEERARRGSMSGGRLGASLGGASFNKGRTGRALNITVEAPKGGIGGGGKTLPFAAAQVHIPELDMYNSEKAAMDDLTDWLDSFEEEQASYNSTVLLAQVRMEEALKNTKGMGIPNTVRTKVVTQLMNAILAKFGRFRDITGLLFSELMLSVYQAPEERDAEPYFLKYDRLKQDYHTLEAQQTLLQRELKQSEAKSNNRMAYARRTMANMLKRSLKQGFLLWKDGVEAKKNSRRQLAKIVKRWRQLDIMRAFDQWRQAVYEIREKRMLGKLEEQEKSIDGLGARNLQLEEELERERRARDEALRMLEEERKKQQWMLDEMARLKADLEEANRKIQDSREDEFRELATEYKGVLAAHWEAELAELREKCDSMTYHDPGRLLAVNENMDSLYQVDKQELIVRWMNVHLKANGMEDVMNLSTDLRDGKELVLLNHLADPTRASLKWLKEVDPQRVAMRVLEDACTLFNFPRGVLEDDGSSITKSIGDLCYNLAAHMFEYHPMLHRNFSEGATVDALKELQDTIQDFNRTSATDGVSEGYPRQLMSKMKEIRALVAATDAEGKSAEERLRYLACEARSFGIHMLGARIAGEPMELQDARMGEEVIAYTKLNRFKVSDLLPMSDESDAELRKIEELLKAYFKDNKRIYKFYAQGGAMSSQEYWKFVKDCKMPDKKFYGAKFDIAFQDSNREVDEHGHTKINFGEEDDDNPDFELLPAELMETLLRISMGKYRAGTAVERLERLFLECITPFACKSDSEEFRATLGGKEVREVLQKHRDNMRKIFIKYSGADVATNAAAAKSSSMNAKEVDLLFKSVNLIGQGVDYTDLRKIFALVQDADGNDGDDADEDSELVFTEFLEMMGCVAMYRDPNPYIPFAKRLDTFLMNDITRPLVKKMKLTLPMAGLRRTSTVGVASPKAT